MEYSDRPKDMVPFLTVQQTRYESHWDVGNKHSLQFFNPQGESKIALQLSKHVRIYI
jgi:hypothetical protein